MRDGNRWRGWLDTLLTVAAVATSLFAIGVVVALVWWVHSLSNPEPRDLVTPVRSPVREQAARPLRPVQPSSLQQAPPAQHVASAAGPSPPASAPTAAVPARGPNDDVAKNRALGAALSRLGDDPELQRKLRQ